MSPVVCMITDRARLTRAGGVRRDTHAELDALVEQVRAAAAAGVHLVQLRERDLDGRALFDLARRCVAAVSGTRTRVLVNDRLDVALAAAAHGVHLRGDSFPGARARPWAPPPFLIGRSIHSAEEARTDHGAGADYLVFGPVYETLSKPGKAAAGRDALHAVCAVTTVPVLAVGGITADTLGDVARAGAAGFAAIGMFCGEPDELSVIVRRATLAFDTSANGYLT